MHSYVYRCFPKRQRYLGVHRCVTADDDPAPRNPARARACVCVCVRARACALCVIVDDVQHSGILRTYMNIHAYTHTHTHTHIDRKILVHIRMFVAGPVPQVNLR
jgi:hypothetical protein